MLVDSGKQAWAWICKKPKAAEYDPLVFLGFGLDQHTTEAQGEDFDSRSPGTQRPQRSANVRQEQESFVSYFWAFLLSAITKVF